MTTNEMKAAAAMTPLAKMTALFRLGNYLASLARVSLLPRDRVEPDVASQSVILIRTSVSGKVRS